MDPSAAIINLYHELSETLMRIFATEGRTMKHYVTKDENQLPRAEIQRIVEQGAEAIMPNTFGDVVRNYTEVNFIERRHPSNQEYVVEHYI